MPDPSTSQPLVGQSAQTAQGSVGLKLKANLAPYFISAAALFARQANFVEQQQNPTISSGQPWMDHRSYVLGAVTASASFLEAAINELYLEAIDRNRDTFGAHMRLAELMEHVWETVEEQSVLGKYQIALTLAEKPSFPKGDDPYQAADALIHLRNAIVHYKPEWDSEPDVNRRLEQRLSSRFPHNPYEQRDKPFFPHRCLGHGCAAWSVTIAVSFYREFITRIGLPQRTITGSLNLSVT